MRSHLLEGTVRHRRSRPAVYELEHDVFYVALDLDEVDLVARRLRLVSRNRRNVLSFRDADHLVAGGGPLRTQVDDLLRGVGVDPAGLRVTLVANLRVFGYVFNPASFFLCHDAAGALVAVVVEVHNTHGERHVYPLVPESPGSRKFRASMDKAFYVSPFIDMAARYTLHVLDEPDSLRIAIAESEHGDPLLTATVVARRVPLTDRMLARMLVRYPLVTHRTIADIHLHALRLWRRGIRFHRHRRGTGNVAPAPRPDRGPHRAEPAAGVPAPGATP